MTARPLDPRWIPVVETTARYVSGFDPEIAEVALMRWKAILAQRLAEIHPHKDPLVCAGFAAVVAEAVRKRAREIESAGVGKA